MADLRPSSHKAKNCQNPLGTDYWAEEDFQGYTMNRKIEFKVLIALSLAVPIALLFLMADAFTADTAIAGEKKESVAISRPAAAVGYGEAPVILCVGDTKTREAAGRGEIPSNLFVDPPNVASASFFSPPGTLVTLVSITGLEVGTAKVIWTVGVGTLPITLDVIVEDCG